MPQKKGIVWTDKQREIARLMAEGKTHSQLRQAGFYPNLIQKVKRALEQGGVPPSEEEALAKAAAKEEEQKSSQKLVSVKSPSPSPIVFRLDKKEIALDPIQLNKQYGYYEDIIKKDGLTNTFSEVQTIGIQLVWLLMQDIPLSENMISGILYG